MIQLPQTEGAIRDRESGSLMKIRVKAKNAAGLSDPSDKIVIRFPKVN